jgi:hypothetical protein
MVDKFLSSSRAERECHDGVYRESGDGFKVKGLGVSMQNERSPTEMLRKVVRL